jgi:hypothetical protein
MSRERQGAGTASLRARKLHRRLLPRLKRVRPIMRQLASFSSRVDLVLWSAVLVVAAFAAAPAARAQAPDASAGPAVQRNVYAAAGAVRPSGPVQGDFLAAGGRVTIDQPVGGDVSVAGGSVDVRAPIGDDLRAVGGDIAIGSNVGGELFVAGGNVALRAGSNIAGPARIHAGTAVIDGRIGGDLTAYAQKLTINGVVLGRVRVAAQDVELGPAARVAGGIDYAGATEPRRAPGAIVGGAITRTEGATPRQERGHRAPGAFWAGGFFSFVALLACGTLLLLVAPGFAARAPMRIASSPWRAFGFGLAALLAVPIVAVLLCITLLGIPLGIAVMALAPVLMLAGFLVGALHVSGLLTSALSRAAPAGFTARVGYLALALVVLLLVARVPFAGPLAMLLVTLTGVGACALEWRGRGSGPAAPGEASAPATAAIGPPEWPRHA